MVQPSQTKPKMLTPPDSPVLSELMPPSDLLKLPPHNGNQMVPNLDLENGKLLLQPRGGGGGAGTPPHYGRYMPPQSQTCMGGSGTNIGHSGTDFVGIRGGGGGGLEL